MENKMIPSVITKYGIVKFRKESKTGYIQIDYNYVNNNGEKKRKKKSLGIAYNTENIKDAKEYLLSLEMDIDGNFKSVKEVKRGDITALEFFKEFKNEIRSDTVRLYTKDTYIRNFEQHILPKISNYYLKDIKTKHLNDIFKELKASKLSVKTLKNIRIPTNKYFELAFDSEYIKVNPMKDLKRNYFFGADKTNIKGLTIEEKKEVLEAGDIIDPFTKKEVLTLINTAKGKFRNFIAIMFFTGMRPSELIYLKWNSINFEEAYLIVEGAVTGKETKEERNETKTLSSQRVVPLSEQALKYLIDQKQYSKSNKYDEVFLNQYGNPYANHQSFVDNEWNNLFDRPRKDRAHRHKFNNLNIRYRRLYQLRHSWASINLSEKALPLLFLSKMLGHKTPQVTLEKYSSWVKNDDITTLNMLNTATNLIFLNTNDLDI